MPQTEGTVPRQGLEGGRNAPLPATAGGDHHRAELRAEAGARLRDSHLPLCRICHHAARVLEANPCWQRAAAQVA